MGVAVLIGVLAVWMLSRRRARKGRFGGAWNIIKGRHLDGNWHSNATWFRRGTQPAGELTRVTRWGYMAGYQRLGVWVGVPTFLVLFAYGYWKHRALTLGLVFVVAAGFFTLIGILVWSSVRESRHSKTVTEPLAAVLGPFVGQDRGVRPKAWIDSHRDYRDAGVTVHPPASFRAEPEQRNRISEIAAGRLGGDWRARFDMTGPDPTIHLRHIPEPPPFVDWGMFRRYAADAEPLEPVIGLGSKMIPVLFPLDREAQRPHRIYSSPSGGGKSALGRAVGMHVLHHGGKIDVLDAYKQISQEWTYSPTLIPGVTYSRTVPEVHRRMIEIQKEILDRYSNPDIGSLPPWLIIIEELPTQSALLQSYWMEIRPKGNSLNKSPARSALEVITNTVRQANGFLLILCQRASQDAFGGPGGTIIRESCVPIIGAAASDTTWDMLAGDEVERPAPSEVQGRAYVVGKVDAEPVQIVYTTDEEAREWAMTGVPQPVTAPKPPTMPVFS